MFGNHDCVSKFKTQSMRILFTLPQATTILPISFDDGIVSYQTCDKLCTSIPWLLSTGASIVFSALFTKLWRINRLFHAERFQRMKISERDVIGPFLVLFGLNLTLLITWTILDPLKVRTIKNVGFSFVAIEVY